VRVPRWRTCGPQANLNDEALAPMRKPQYSVLATPHDAAPATWRGGSLTMPAFCAQAKCAQAPTWLPPPGGRVVRCRVAFQSTATRLHLHAHARGASAHHVQRHQVVLARVRKARLRQLRPARERLAPLLRRARRVGQRARQRCIKHLRCTAASNVSCERAGPPDIRQASCKSASCG